MIRVRRYLCRLCEHKALKAAVAASKMAAEQEKIAQLMLETPVRVLHR